MSMGKSSQGQLKLRHLSFRLLEVYVQVVRLGNISAAAREGNEEQVEIL